MTEGVALYATRGMCSTITISLMRPLYALTLLAVSLCAVRVDAQTAAPMKAVSHVLTATTDSSWNTAGEYWRRRVVLRGEGADSVSVACYGGVAIGYGARAILGFSQPWDRDDIEPNAKGQLAGRVDLRWSDGSTDQWSVTFGYFEATTDASPFSGAGRNFASAWVANSDNFLKRLAETDFVAVDYPTKGWYRSFMWQPDQNARSQIAEMRSRCAKRNERKAATR